MVNKPDRILGDLNKSDTPPGLCCTATGCAGHLIRKPDEQFKGHYASPECDVCEKVYPLATGVPKIPHSRRISRR